MDFSGLYSYFSPELATFIVSMLPVAELRVSIPLAIGVYDMDPLRALFISLLGNIFSVFIVLLLVEKIFLFFSQKSAKFERFFKWLLKRTKEKNNVKFEKWGDLALIFFVAIPLPMTGGWSGALAALVFNVPLKKAMALISFGICIAGAIVTSISLGVFLN